MVKMQHWTAENTSFCCAKRVGFRKLKTFIAERTQICVTSVSLCSFLLLIAMFSTAFLQKNSF